MVLIYSVLVLIVFVLDGRGKGKDFLKHRLLTTDAMDTSAFLAKVLNGFPAIAMATD